MFFIIYCSCSVNHLLPANSFFLTNVHLCLQFGQFILLERKQRPCGGLRLVLSGVLNRPAENKCTNVGTQDHSQFQLSLFFSSLTLLNFTFFLFMRLSSFCDSVFGMVKIWDRNVFYLFYLLKNTLLLFYFNKQNRQTHRWREDDSQWGIVRVEGLSKKEKGLMDMDNSVMTAVGRRVYRD